MGGAQRHRIDSSEMSIASGGVCLLPKIESAYVRSLRPMLIVGSTSNG